MTQEDNERLHRWLDSIVPQQPATMHNTNATTPNTNSNPSITSTSTSSSSSAASETPSSTPQPVAVIPPFRHLCHLLLASFFTRSSTAPPSSAHSITALGQLVEAWRESCFIHERIQRLQQQQRQQRGASQNSTTAAAAATAEKGGSTLRRLQIRQRELGSRISSLRRQVAKANYVHASSSEEVCDFPSAALVAQTLQVIGVLPDPDNGQPLILEPPHSSVPSTAASDSSDSSTTATTSIPRLRIAPEHLPPAAAYTPKQFLSSAHVPLIYKYGAPDPIAATAAATAANSTQQQLPECSFHREMYLKSFGKQLTYELEEY